jgi:hypothetical protein
MVAGIASGRSVAGPGGVEPDATRIEYYRGRWNAGDISSR